MATPRTLLRHGFRLATTTTPPRTMTPRLTTLRPSTNPIHLPTFRSFHTTSPTLSSPEAPDYLDERELHIFKLIKETLQPTQLEVQDISGGCGSMYALDITSEQFKGLPVIKQHRLVNKVLGEEIKKWHGVQLKTKAP